jgi:cysteine desulfurase
VSEPAAFPAALSRALYFDGHATTPCDPRVVAAMLPYFTERFGNASSAQHPFGWAAREAVERARGQVAALIGARPRDIVFTSGATESNNLAIQGAVRALRDRGGHVVTLATEHTAVLDVCAALESGDAGPGGVEVTRLGVDAAGLVDPAAVEAALRADTVLVSVMAANNEIGVLQPIAAIGAIARVRGIAFHVDAAQAAGKVALDVEAIGADLLSLSAHKCYGPKGVGALYVRRRGPVADLPPMQHGGGHERGLRSGTLNVPGIVGFGAAAAIARAEMAADAVALGALRDRLLASLQAGIDGVHLNGAASPRLPHSLNVRFDRVDGRELLMALSDLSLSSGAACCTASAEPSHVLKAIGLSDDAARASLRFGLIRGTSATDVDTAVATIAGVVAALRR